MIKKQFYMGFAGFLGFFSIRYLFDGNLLNLTLIGFFAFFANFIIAKINGDKADERYIENQKSAMAFIGQFAIFELFVLWCATAIIRNAAITNILIALTYAITCNLYAIKLYVLEEK